MSSKPSIIKRALISVSDKEGLVAFATQLHQLGIELIATDNTAKHLREFNIPIINIKDVTDFPEILDGRVKTLHPHIHAGILARRGKDDATLKELAIDSIDLVVVNLYPFEKTVANPKVTLEQAIEHIDIGGPTLLRGAAKNYEFVTAVVDPSDYSMVLEEIKKLGGTSLKTRENLAKKVFAHTAEYDSAIANYFWKDEKIFFSLTKKTDLRYGENPHQKAALYTKKFESNTLTQAKQHQGKSLSFNNLMDSHAALQCVRYFSEIPTCVIVKHATPCGVAQNDSMKNAYLKALATDPVSAFGGIIAINQTLDAETATCILENQFAEVILAPDVEDSALAILSTKKNIRVLSTGSPPAPQKISNFHSISGGILIQDEDNDLDNSNQFTVMTKRQPTTQEMSDCLFAWRVVHAVKSNAIVYARHHQTLGIGAGQTSRVFSAEIAVLKAKAAGFSLQNAVAASDAFFPFADGVEVAVKAGITAIIQPGGSKNDEEIIATANQYNIAMIFTHVRHFKH